MNRLTNKAIGNILEQLPTMVWKTDKELQCNYVNKIWEDFTGKERKESLNFEWLKVVHPNDLEKLARLRTEIMSNMEPFSMELRFQRHDGVYRWYMVTGAPFYDIENSYAGYLGSAYDITERKQTEESLRLYKMLSDNANDIILFIDMDGRIIEANNAAVKAYGYTYEELCSKLIYNIREDWGYTNSQMEIAYQGGIYFQAFHKRKDGSIFPVEVSSKGTYIGSSKILLSIVRDITNVRESELELKRAKEAAEVASKAKGEFLANMSHEIRTPLNGIVGMIDLTLLSDLSEEQKDNLRTAKSCADSLLKIINDILDFSKMEAGKLVFQNINFNPKDVVGFLIKAHSPVASAKGLQLNHTFSSSIPEFITGDPSRITQVLNNLISNAIKFTDKGRIDISVKDIGVTNDEIELVFSVADTGIGFATENIELIFESFSQVDPSYTKRFGGTGLGLAITKKLIETMGGTLCVESEKGKGSIFCFFMKFMISKDMAEKIIDIPQINKTIRPLRILLVEDDITNQKVIFKMLNERGHLVEKASNGKEAVSLFEKVKYDVILMDIHMPVMNGIEAARLIKEMDDSDNQTPIIALTAYALQGDREKFLSLGMDGYISKPIQMDEFFYTLDRLTYQNKNFIENIPNRVVLNSDGEIHFTLEEQYIQMEKIGPIISDVYNLIIQIDVAIENAEYETIEAIAHNIKLISNKIDAVEIKDSAFKIELAARRGDLNRIIMQSEKIKHKFKTYKESII